MRRKATDRSLDAFGIGARLFAFGLTERRRCGGHHERQSDNQPSHRVAPRSETVARVESQTLRRCVSAFVARPGRISSRIFPGFRMARKERAILHPGYDTACKSVVVCYFLMYLNMPRTVASAV